VTLVRLLQRFVPQVHDLFHQDAKLVRVNNPMAVMFVDADGTRHLATCTAQETYVDGGKYSYHTPDGPFIDYSYIIHTISFFLAAQARYPNGTVVDFTALGSGAAALQLSDGPGGRTTAGSGGSPRKKCALFFLST
jgi:hypothetical protein